MQDLAAAFCLVLIIEGVMPFLSPDGMRRTASMVSQLPDRTLRIAGLVSMLIGVLLLQLVR